MEYIDETRKVEDMFKKSGQFAEEIEEQLAVQEEEEEMNDWIICAVALFSFLSRR